MRLTARLAIMCFAALWPFVPRQAEAQLPDTAKASAKARLRAPTPAAPCCSIVRIDKALATATARETATGFTFRFKLKDRALVESIKVGDKVWADFAKKTVTLKVTELAPCCSIIATPPPEEGPAPSTSRSPQPEP